MSASGKRRKQSAVAVAATVCVLSAGIALGRAALEPSTGLADLPAVDRTQLVDVPEVGIAVPYRTTELVDISRARLLRAVAGGRSVFLAPGAGEYSGAVCIFTALPKGGTDVVPIACESVERARTIGLDLGESTSSGGVSGVVVRVAPDGSAAAETYAVGPEGGTVSVRPGPGPTISLHFQNMEALDARADREARETARAHARTQP